MNVTMQAPSTLYGAQLNLQDGTQKAVGANGAVTLDTKYIPEMLRIGFQIGSDEDVAITTGITALAGGGQTGATALALGFNRIDTVATAGDSVVLPNSAPGIRVIVHNNAAKPCQVFGLAGDTVNGIAAATGLRMPGNALDVFYCPAAGTWIVESAFGFAGQLATGLWQDAITAFATGGQASAVLLAAEINRVTVCATAGDSVKLPVANPGVDVIVINTGASPLAVFPNTGDTINGLAANASVTQQTNSFVLYACSVAGSWFTEGLGTGFSGSLATVSFADALTAFATGGQASATAITTGLARFTVVATAGDSAKLPVAAAGLSITVINASTANNSMNVFPATGDKIGSQAINTALAVPAGTVATFYTTTTGVWHVLTTNPSASIPFTQYTSISSGNGTLTAAQMSGAAYTVLITSGATANTTATATALFANIPNCQVGLSYILRIVNTNGGTLTLTMDASITATGTLTLATVTWRDFIITFTSATAATMKQIGTGTQS